MKPLVISFAIFFQSMLSCNGNAPVSEPATTPEPDTSHQAAPPPVSQPQTPNIPKDIFDEIYLVLKNTIELWDMSEPFAIRAEPIPGFDSLNIAYLTKGSTLKPDDIGIGAATKGPRELLTQAEADFMRQQKKNAEGFRWDNTIVGFGYGDDKAFAFSVPLFTPDKKHALLQIMYFVDGKPLWGESYLLVKTKGRWGQKEHFANIEY